MDEAVIRFRQWLESLDVVPTLVAMRQKMEGIADAEVARTLHSLDHLPQKDRDAIFKMARVMVNKMLHDPTLFLKGQGYHEDKSAYIDFARKLFKLDP